MKSTRMVYSLTLLSLPFCLSAAASSSDEQSGLPRYDRDFLRNELIALGNESLCSIASEQHLKNVAKDTELFNGRLATLDYIDGAEKFSHSSTEEPANKGACIEDERFEGGQRIVGTRFPKNVLFARYAAKNAAAYQEQIQTLNEQANALFAKAKLSPEEAYYVRAVLNGFLAYELDGDVRAYIGEAARPYPVTHEDIEAQEQEFQRRTQKTALLTKAFSGSVLPKPIRFAGATMLANAISAVQDPSPTTGFRSIFGTYEPTVVRNFNALQNAMLEEEDPKKKEAFIKEWDEQLTIIHGHATNYLASLLNVDRETKEARIFAADIRDLNHTLRRLEEAEMLYAHMTDDFMGRVRASSSND